MTKPLDEDRCWAAVLTRDPAADGSFLYSVRSTGVYCRPSCGSRRPRRPNVAFHRTAADAERAGFRPCRRCRPDQPPLVERHRNAVAAACARLAVDDEVRLDELAAAVGMSPYHFHRIFKTLTGVTPKAYAAARRAQRIGAGLTGADTVTEALYQAGFSSSGAFYGAAAELLGMPPGSYRRGGPGETIRFAVGACSLGAILVAATAKGICAILLGTDPEALLNDLQARFPRAELVGGDADFERQIAAVVGLIEQPATDSGLPLDVRGTAFQRRVWEALRRVPPGKTTSYAELAGAIGRPGAARAVAGACAANPLAVAIPCHRVVRRDGGLGGYRWGVDRKQALLYREAAGAAVAVVPEPDTE